jgi:hypothetical protein
MDPVNANEIDPAAAAVAAAAGCLLIVQLSPVTGNIYDSDRFYYDPAGVLTEGPFGAVVAFAVAGGS